VCLIRLQPPTNTMEINMTLKDELDAYKAGYDDGKKQVLDLIKWATNLEFKETSDLIVWIRSHQGVQNETE